MSVYDISGNLIGDVAETDENTLFASNMQLDYKHDEESDTNYTVIRIFKTRKDGEKQYPFAYCPNKMNAATQSALEMNRIKKFPIAINAGIIDTSTMIPIGTVIENGVAIRDGADIYRPVLTIDGNGNLGTSMETSAATLVSQGIVSALVGVGNNPIISNYEIPSGQFITDHAQRQIIGQFGNGDYAIITCEGRSNDNSTGWSIPEAQRVCQELGLKFAYNLDGGGSTETVIGGKQINAIYERTNGRIVSTFIVFNGTTEFPIN